MYKYVTIRFVYPVCSVYDVSVLLSGLRIEERTYILN